MAGTNTTSLEYILGIRPELKDVQTLKSGLVKVVSDASGVFSKRMSQKIAEALKQQHRGVARIAQEVHTLEKRLDQERLTAQERAATQAQLRLAKTSLSQEERAFRSRLLQEDQIIKRREAAFEKTLKSQRTLAAVGGMGEKFGDEVSSAFADLTSQDLPRMLKSSLGKTGKMLEKGGTKIFQSSKDPGDKGAQFGKLLSSLGSTLALIGAVAAGLAMIFKIFLDMDAKIKEINKDLLEGGTAAADLGDSFGQIKSSLTTVRKAVTDFDFNKSWGVVAKDNIALINSFSEAGLTFKEITKGSRAATESITMLQESMAQVFTMSKLTGMAVPELAGHMAEYVEDMGLGLEGVTTRFHNVLDAAKNSGFATKRFMGMLLQATSGMSMYNVRLEEAAGLLMQLGDILGSKMGGEFLQNLSRGFRDTSVEDRVLTAKKAGVGRLNSIYRKGAELAAEELQKRIGESKVGDQIWNTLTEAMRAGGQLGANEIAETLGARDLASKLSGLSEDARDDLVYAVSKIDKDLARQIGGQAMKSMAFRGGLGGTQASMQVAGPAETLLTKLYGAAAVLGKRVDQINPSAIYEAMASGKISGSQGEEFLQLYNVGGQYAAMARDIKKAQEELKKSPHDLATINESLKKAGLMLDESGKAFRISEEGGIGPEVKGFDDLILTAGKELEGAMAKLDPKSDAEEIAQGIASQTTELAKVLEQGTESILARLYDVVLRFYNWVTGEGMKEGEKEMQTKLVRQASEDAQKAREEMLRAREEKTKLEKQLSVERDDEKKKALLEEMKVWDKEISSAKARESAAQRRGSAYADVRPEDVETMRRAGVSVEGRIVGAAQRSLLKTTLGSSKTVDSAARMAASSDRTKASPLQKSFREKSGDVASNIWHANLGEVIGRGLAQTIYGRAPTGESAPVEGGEQRTALKKWWVEFMRKELQYLLHDVPGAMAPTSLGESENFAWTVGDTMSWKSEGKSREEKLEDLRKYLEGSLSDPKRAREIMEYFRKELIAYDKQEELLKTNPKDTATEIDKKARDRDKERLEAFLRAKGVGGEKAVAKALMGKGPLPGWVNKKVAPLQGDLLQHFGGVLGGGALGTLKPPEVKDFLMRVGKGGMEVLRIDPNDVLMGAKPGGAVAGAKTARGGVNVFHLYGEGPGVLNTITKAQRAGLLS